MSESWDTLLSYRLHDLLMFSAATYFGLFEAVNRRTWPAALVGQGTALLVLAAILARIWRSPAADRPKAPAPESRLRSALPVAAVLATALATATVPALYFRGGFADIHWLGPAWTWAFVGHAALLLMLAAWLVLRKGAVQTQAGVSLQGLSVGLAMGAVCWPMLAPMGQRPWWQAEVVGLAPDPTVLLSLGLVLWLRLPRPWSAALTLLPLAWCIFSGATLWALEEPQALVLPLAALVALLCVLRRRH